MGPKHGLSPWHILPHNLTQITRRKQELFANLKKVLLKWVRNKLISYKKIRNKFKKSASIELS